MESDMAQQPITYLDFLQRDTQQNYFYNDIVKQTK